MEGWGGISSAEMRAVDENAEWLGVDRSLLMENAGAMVAKIVYQWLGGLTNKRIVVVCGTGNNGGDGLAAARHMAGLGADVSVVLVGDPMRVKTMEARRNLDVIMKMKQTVRFQVVRGLDDVEKLRNLLGEAEAVVDAIFGTGIKGAIREPWRTIIEMINSVKGLRFAVDIPSGVDPDTGEVRDIAVNANVTITFHRPKLGLPAAADYCGEVIVAPIGIPPEAEFLMGPGDTRLALNLMKDGVEVMLFDDVSGETLKIFEMLDVEYGRGRDPSRKVVYLGEKIDLIHSCRDAHSIIALNMPKTRDHVISIIDRGVAEQSLGLKLHENPIKVCENLTKKASDLNKTIYIYGELDLASNGSRYKMSWIDRPLNEEGLNVLIGFAIALMAREVEPLRALSAAGYLAGHVARHGLGSLKNEVKRLKS